MCIPYQGRFMRLAMTLLSAALALIGGNEHPRATVATRASIDGVAVGASRTTIAQDVAQFQCIESRSGHCSHVLFLSDCPISGAAADKAAVACRTQLVDPFTLAKGGSKQVADLPQGFRFCVGDGARPVAPGCAD